MKTEMLVQMEGCDPTSTDRRVLLIGATNRPEVGHSGTVGGWRVQRTKPGGTGFVVIVHIHAGLRAAMARCDGREWSVWKPNGGRWSSIWEGERPGCQSWSLLLHCMLIVP